MKIIRTAVTALAAAAGVASVATAADFPAKPVTIIVPFGAGGGTDITTRTLAGPMAEALGADIVVKNTAGAGGTIGAAETARARTDGYTIGMMPVGPMTTQPHLRELPYGPESFDYICQAYSAPSALVVRADSPFGSLEEMLAHAKSHPGKLNYGVQAVGSIPHVAGLAWPKLQARNSPSSPTRAAPRPSRRCWTGRSTCSWPISPSSPRTALR